jgi:hypothetical protein
MHKARRRPLAVQQGQPSPIRPRQTHDPRTLGDSELMARHQYLGVLPPRLSVRQTQHLLRIDPQ